MSNYMYCFSSRTPVIRGSSLHFQETKNFYWVRLVRNCCKFSGFLGGYCSDGCLLGCYTVYGSEFDIFRKNILPPPSGWQHVRDLFPFRLATILAPEHPPERNSVTVKIDGEGSSETSQHIRPTVRMSPGDHRLKRKYLRLPREDAATSLTYLHSGRI